MKTTTIMLLAVMIGAWLAGCAQEEDKGGSVEAPPEVATIDSPEEVDPVMVEIGLGSFAKRLCSSVFVSGRSPDHVFAEELSGPDAQSFDFSIDSDNNIVKALAPNGQEVVVLYREHLGCTLARGATIEELRAQFDPAQYPPIPSANDALWPEGNRVDLPAELAGLDMAKVNAAVDKAFRDIEPGQNIRTRAVVVIRNGRIIAERYVPPFGPMMPQLGWSMTKTVTNALTGILTGDGKLNVEAPAPVPEWQVTEGDPRADITLGHLLRMSSGLEFSEVYTAGSLSDVILMLYGPDSYSAGAYTANRSAGATPGSRWYYSSGTTNLISRIHRQTFADQQKYFNFPRERLFNKLGMRSAVMEPDTSGVFVGSSYMYATPRDWAKTGLLFLRDGVWQGERLLPEGWVDYSLTPAAAAPGGNYGAQIWLNRGSDERGDDRPHPELPPNMFYLSGFEGQNVVMLPDEDIIVVRMGLTEDGPRPIWPLVREVLDAVE